MKRVFLVTTKDAKTEEVVSGLVIADNFAEAEEKIYAESEGSIKDMHLTEVREVEGYIIKPIEKEKASIAEAIEEAKKLLRKNGYVVKKLTKGQLEDAEDCEKCGFAGDCSECRCSICIIQ